MKLVQQLAQEHQEPAGVIQDELSFTILYVRAQ